MFKRAIYSILFNRLKEDRRFIQVITGPRQVGKTTVVQQVAADLHLPVFYASADEPSLRAPIWIEQQWELARLATKNDVNGMVPTALIRLQKSPK